MQENPQVLEQLANKFLTEQNYSKAYKLFKKAGNLYRKDSNHRQAALCFALAASCWSMKSGEKRFINAALSYEEAAKEAEASLDLEYASLLNKQAAINYERDREFLSLSESLYRSKECFRKFLTYLFISPHKIHSIRKTKEKKDIKTTFKRMFLLFGLTISFILWGYGERPFRTLLSGILIIFLSTFFYLGGTLIKEGVVFKAGFLEALYFSIITFTTVGYGDIAPLGTLRIIAAMEAFCGIFIMPLFIIGLTRKYLRI